MPTGCSWDTGKEAAHLPAEDVPLSTDLKGAVSGLSCMPFQM